jgi:hypothetical protein
MIDMSIPGDEIWIAGGTLEPYWAFGDSPAPLYLGSPPYSGNPPPWVSSTWYLPDRLNWAFVLKEGVKIYGGFKGTERTLAEKTGRDWKANVTTLSGGLTARHVIIAANMTDPGKDTLLDGLTISGGNAGLPGPGLSISGEDITRDHGGGIHIANASPRLNNVILKQNIGMYGGAIYTKVARPILTNVSIENNTSGGGGGLYNKDSSPVLLNVRIEGNTAAGVEENFIDSPMLQHSIGYSIGAGAGIFNRGDCHPVLVNVSIRGNTSIQSSVTKSVWNGASYDSVFFPGGGAGIFNTRYIVYDYGLPGLVYSPYPSSTLINVTLSGNSALSGAGGMDTSKAGTHEVFNSVLSGNGAANVTGDITVYNSIVDGLSGPEVLTGSPVNRGDSDYYPLTNPASPFFTAISGLSIPPDILVKILECLHKDVDGKARFNGVIDLGAREQQP